MSAARGGTCTGACAGVFVASRRLPGRLALRGAIMSAQRWYVRRGTQVRGPFPASVILHFKTRGKLTEKDEVSTDLTDWRPLASLAGRARPKPGATSRDGATSGETRASLERPVVPPAPLAPRSAYVQKLLNRRDNRWLQGGAVGVLLAAIFAVGLTLGGGDSSPGADCAAAAAAGVNWSSCGKDATQLAGAELSGAILRGTRVRGADLKGAHLTGADLSYAEFGGSTLAYAQLGGSNLKGATLKGTDLSYADLAGADLSYADLSGARVGGARLNDAVLDNAIWTDGRICAVGSVGACL